MIKKKILFTLGNIYLPKTNWLRSSQHTQTLYITECASMQSQ